MTNNPEIKKLAIAQGETVSNGAIAPYQSLSAYLQQAVNCLPDGQLISLDIDNDFPVIQTYSQLWHRATCILGGLRNQGIKPGQFIVTVLDRCEDFVAVLWGCWLGGFVPIPVKFSLNQSQPNQPKLRIKTALEATSQSVILTTEELATALRQDEQFRDELNHNLTLIQLEKLQTAAADDRFHQSQPEDLAALFLSSGTTGKPKLVSFNCQAIFHRLSANLPDNPQDIRSLYWLPLDHASASLRIANPDAEKKIFLPTEAFLIDPLRWLDTIEQYGVTKTSITNFGMALVHQFVESASDRHWDLRSLQNIGIGAEAIMPRTYEAFLKSLQPFGLRSDIIYTGYGLTECGTVVGGKASFVSISNVDSQEIDRQYMQLGRPCRGYSIRIVNEQGSVVNEGEIGHVQVIGPSTTTQYYNNIKETQALFSEDRWMNTGDLGFIQAGNLAITGRDKEIIIINAQNYSCQEIEQVVNSVEGVESSGTIACGVRQADSATDNLAIFFMTNYLTANQDNLSANQELVKLINQIRLTVATQLNITPSYVIPIAQSSIPRNAFGKVQRKKLVERLQTGEFNQLIQNLETIAKEQAKVNFIPPSTETEKAIAQIWSKVFRHEHIGVKDNFFDLGGQSLIAAQVISNIKDKLGIDLPLAILFEHPTVAELAPFLDRQIDRQKSLELITYTSLIHLKSDGVKPPLYFVNSTAKAHDLIPFLDSEQPLYSLNIFGLTARLKRSVDRLQMRDFATAIVADIQVDRPTGPYKFIGFCQDGALTLEIAQQLRARGEVVELVCFIDVFFQKQDITVFDRLPIFNQLGLIYLVTKFKAYLSNFSKPLKQTVRKIDNAEKVELDRKLYGAYRKAAGNYNPLPYGGRIVALQSSEWSYKDRSKLEAISHQGLEVYEIKGLHNHLFEQPSIHELAKTLNRCLNNDPQKRL
jgi:acyl-CoA synthetase (AMP-forming)/AMP-acid ligase II/thioesterase domain-containing protein/acyl carrier protein